MLELGCGTGSMTEALRRRGYDMIGIDNSEEMLAAAIEKLWRMAERNKSFIYVRICGILNYTELSGRSSVSVTV